MWIEALLDDPVAKPPILVLFMIGLHKISGGPALGLQNRWHVRKQSHDTHMRNATGGNDT